MYILALLFFILSIYLVLVLWTLKSKVSNGDFGGAFLAPFKEEPQQQFANLQSDPIFMKELENVIHSYSDIEPIDSDHFEGVVDDFLKFEIQFMGDSRKLVIFKKSIETLIRNRVYAHFNFSTSVFSYDKQVLYDIYIITFLFSVNEKQHIKLLEYEEREKTLSKQKAIVPTILDDELQEELEKNGY